MQISRTDFFFKIMIKMMIAFLFILSLKPSHHNFSGKPDFIKMLTSQRFPTTWPDTNPQCGRAVVQSSADSAPEGARLISSQSLQPCLTSIRIQLLVGWGLVQLSIPRSASAPSEMTNNPNKTTFWDFQCTCVRSFEVKCHKCLLSGGKFK